MNTKTLKALRESVKKWQDILHDGAIDEGYRNCPLCRLFNKNGEGDCEGCPVSEDTKQRHCAGSPYEKWEAYWDGSAWVPFVNNAATRRLAQAELEFLKSLLPRKVKK